jgi:hypothetical protein
MLVRYTTPNHRLTIELDVTTGKQAFELVAAIQELFEEGYCGCCKSDRIRCDVREFDGNSYYKIVCMDCNAQIDLGQHKNGKGLFIKRTKDGKVLPNSGWYVWQKPQQQQT